LSLPATSQESASRPCDAARQISAWVQEHFSATTVGGATVYDLTT
jgi:hypothetical protein